MTVVLFFTISLIYLAESVNSYTRVTVVVTIINDKLSEFKHAVVSCAREVVGL